MRSARSFSVATFTLQRSARADGVVSVPVLCAAIINLPSKTTQAPEFVVFMYTSVKLLHNMIITVRYYVRMAPIK